MARYSSDHKEQTKVRILTEAESIWKSKGLAGTTVEAVMDSAGLTVGGFYAHFRSKDALLTETLKYSLRQAANRLFSGIKEKSKKEWLSKVIKRYLSQVNHSDLRTACPLPLLTPEMARANPKLKMAFASEFSEILNEALDTLSGNTHSKERAQLLAVISCCVGSVVMARALGDSSLAKEALREVEDLLGTMRFS